MQNCFVPADILLPGAATPLDPWACIAVDQFTSQPEYWQKAEELAKGETQHPAHCSAGSLPWNPAGRIAPCGDPCGHAGLPR